MVVTCQLERADTSAKSGALSLCSPRLKTANRPRLRAKSMTKKKRPSGATLSFADYLEDEAEHGAEHEPGSTRPRKMRNPSVEGAESSSASSRSAALAEALAQEVMLSLRMQNEVAGSSTLRLACTRGDTVDAILGRAAAMGSSESPPHHGLILAIDHWIVPGTATLHWLLGRQWAEGRPMFVLDRDALSAMAASAFAAQKHLFPYRYWEELPAASVPRKYMGAWWQRVPQLNGRPGEKVRLPEWAAR